MEAKITGFFDSVGTFFTGGDQIPWCDSDIVVTTLCADTQHVRKLADKPCKTALGSNSSQDYGKPPGVFNYLNDFHLLLSNCSFVFVSPSLIHLQGCEREVAEAEKGSSDELKSECIMRLSWALVHSKRPEDVQRGIAMLEASLANPGSPLQLREKIYLLAIGHYRSGDYSRSRQLVERCLEV
ncbi:hypothetical protein LguiB_001358 [Lonicera macranthoides]